MIELGDYVAQNHPVDDIFLKKGIVVKSSKAAYEVQWLSYNKDFFLEFKGDAFEELNRRYLLTRMSYARANDQVDIIILSKAGENGVG
jgi:hypothetical protein